MTTIETTQTTETIAAVDAVTDLEKAKAALEEDGYDTTNETDEALYLAVKDAGDDDPDADEALEAIRAIVEPLGCGAEWTGNGNTDADGESTSDIIVSFTG